jgi:hypothetical protein
MITIALILVLLLCVVLLLARRESSFEEGGIPILVVSLPGSSRRERITKDMHENGLEFTFSDGVVIISEEDVKTHLDEFDISGLREGKLTDRLGNVGYTFAFIRAIKYIIDNSIEWTLLIEDDSVLLPDGIKVLKEDPGRYKKFNGWLVVHAVYDRYWWGTNGQIVSLDCAKDLWSKRKEMIEHSMYDHERQLDRLIFDSNFTKWSKTTEPFIIDTWSGVDDPNDSERIRLN